MLHVVVGLSAAMLAALWIWYQWSYNRLLRLARNLPSVLPPLPLVGHAHYFLQNNQAMSTAFIQMISLAESRTSVLWLGPHPLIIIQRPEDIRKVCNGSKTLSKSIEANLLLNFFFGRGLLNAKVNIWKKTRKQFNQLFHTNNLQQLVPSLNVSCQLLVRRLADQVDQGQADLLPLLMMFSLRNVYTLLYGPDIKFDLNSQCVQDYINVISEAHTIVLNRSRFPILCFETVFRFVYRRLMKKLDETWKAFPEKILFEKMEDYHKLTKDKHSSSLIDETSYHMKKGDTSEKITLPEIFTTLQNYDSSFDSSYMRDETQTLTVTGTETVALTLSSCLLAIATHPHVQERLYKEIVDTVGTYFTNIAVEDTYKMTYMDQVLKETLRRFTTIPFITRVCEEDIQLSDCLLPAGTSIGISIVGLNMNPTLFEEPLKFDPDRFSPENSSKRDPYSFLPFSGGPRDCIGKCYAMTVMKITLVHLLRDFELFSNVDINKMKFTYGVSLTSSDGYSVALHQRQ